MTETTAGEGQGDAAPDDRLRALAAAVGATRTRGPAPVEKWNPPHCGAIDMRIAADGTWFYAGTPITRRPLVELFAGILRKDGDRYLLVTPVESVEITVADAPFVAVAMAADGGRLQFATNVGDTVEAGVDHPLRFELDDEGGLKPYLLVRGALWARLTRSLAIDLVDRATTEPDADGRATLGVRSGGRFFPIGPAETT